MSKLCRAENNSSGQYSPGHLPPTPESKRILRLFMGMVSPLWAREATLARITGPESNEKHACVNLTKQNTCFVKLLGNSETPLWGLGLPRDVYHVISKLERDVDTSFRKSLTSQHLRWAEGSPGLPVA